MGSLSFDVQEGVSRLISAAPPTHYNLKINNFSSLAKNSIDRYESGEFQAGGYKWKLVVYPNGNKNKNEKEHVSVYLAMVKENSLPTGWQVYAKFSLFLLDQNNDNYIVLRLERERRFNRSKLEWGFDKFISLKAFNEESNGFLVDDTCEFGAEVFLSTGKGECLSMSKDAIMNKHVWRVENFSKLVAAGNDSITFNAGDHTWKIKLYPRGKGNGLGTHLSLYLALSNPTTLPPGTKIYANFTLRVLCRLGSEYDHYAKVSKWFSASDYEHGWSRFMTLPYFTGYFLITDTCTVEAEVTVHGVAGAL
ncbi:MATH domain and coiled-coil domain-containing protein At3g58370 [Ziziphus jujuba]|uniref:MATH domain and coiled-coil domain-containing protein At3g58370 n=1 Tax=Ziziphus jujuba TaxID=326968 RepID=A0ABM3ZWI8_ZIZJJ|nr:MATH domain and coiled-coil domain-containing protein At3g58370 [Ziziphus jujuba]